MKKTKMPKKQTKCPFCKSSKTSDKESLISQINNKKYILHECRSCKLQFFTPLKFENVYENEKDKSYIPFHKGRTELPSWTIKIGKFLKAHKINLQNKAILDVGAGDCINYELLSNEFDVSSKNYYALELDRKSLASGKKRGVKNIIPKYFDKNILKVHQTFDIIIASEVLEHQVNPDEFMETCFGLLKKDGILIVTVPNRKRMFFKHRSNPEDCPPHHFLRFDKNFFRSNFPDNIIYLDSYGYGFRNIKDSCVIFNEKILKTKKIWIFFSPLVLLMRLFDKPQGIGIITVLKK